MANRSTDDDVVLSLKHQLHTRPPLTVILESIILVAINSLALAGNTFVVIAFIRSPFLRTTTNTFIVALSISDIITSLFPMPLTVGTVISGFWPYGEFLCHIQGFLVHALAFISIEIMALLALNRYYKTLRPYQYTKFFKNRTSVGYITVVCVISCGILCITLFPEPSQSFVFHPGKLICVRLYTSIQMSRFYTAFLSVVFIIIPATVIIVSYTKVLRALRRHNHSIQCRYSQRRGRRSVVLDTIPECNGVRPPFNITRPDVIITRTLVITVVCFFLCWVPCFVIDIADVLVAHALDRRVYLAYTSLAYMSSACNPIVYGIHNPSFRKGFLSFMKCD